MVTHVHENALDKNDILIYSDIRDKEEIVTCFLRHIREGGPIALGGVMLMVILVHTCGAAELKGGIEFEFFDPAPDANDLTLMTTDDRPLKLSDLRGKVILLNFWRRDCPYCEREKKQLKHMTGSLPTEQVVVLCVNFWDSPAWVKSYAKQKGGNLIYTFPMPGSQSLMENRSGKRVTGYYILNDLQEPVYEVPAFPATYIIDKGWKVVAYHQGMAEWTDPRVLGVVLRLATAPLPPTGQLAGEAELPAWLDRLLTHQETEKQPKNRLTPRERLGLTPY